MAVTISQVVILAMGGAVFLLSAWGIALPQKLVAMVTRVMDRRSGIYVAVVARIALGIALISAASVSKFPEAFRVLGWIAIVEAAALPIIGSKIIRSLLGWFEGIEPTLIRVWLIFGLLFGGFLFYGVF